jgi:uncharacterized protein YbjT (DUF2867 family)
MIAIAGGTGTLGRALVARLLAGGDGVRVLARHPDRVPAEWTGSVEGVAVDVRRPGSFGHALSGVRTLVCAVTGFGGPGAGGVDAVDHDGNVALIRGAEAAGVEHVVLLSVAQAAHDHPIELFRAKFAAEQRLRASTCAWTIVRPTAYMETWVELLGRPLVTGSHARVVGRGRNPVNFVAAADVAFVVDAAIHDASLCGETLEVPGPEDRTLDSIVEAVAREVGMAPRIDHAPRSLIRLVAAVISVRNPVLAGQLRAALVMDTRDMRVDPAPLRARFPGLVPTRIEDVIRRQLVVAGGPAPGSAGVLGAAR